jgi:hypothetical protein
MIYLHDSRFFSESRPSLVLAFPLHFLVVELHLCRTSKHSEVFVFLGALVLLGLVLGV